MDMKPVELIVGLPIDVTSVDDFTCRIFQTEVNLKAMFEDEFLV